MNARQELLGRPDALAANHLLRELRRGMKLTGAELAEKLQWTQSKISKIENARQVPTPEDTIAWLDACSATAEVRKRVMQDLAAGRTSHHEIRGPLRHGGRRSGQEQFIQLARQATTIRSMDALSIPGLLQIPEYSQSVLAHSARVRGDRNETRFGATVHTLVAHHEVLYDSSKKLEFVITEAALQFRACSTGTMRGQLDRLLMVMSLPQVDLGIVPFGEQLGVMPPQNSFTLFDDDVALVEMLSEESVQRGAAAAVYATVMNEISASAWRGDKAKSLISKAARQLSSLPQCA